ncbi:ABC transporter ATP-binding protein [Dongia sp.]|uniref:ABC transporter ATP-binding protein n=1 Tax=Dongia sp. TaxID=1977262 RepID=UPI003751FA19
MAEIVFDKVTKDFGNGPVVRDVSLAIAEGEFCVFVGPSGCGKSTLLRMVAGLESITEGEIRIGGRRANDVPPAKRGAALVFQTYALFPHMTVRENLGFGLKVRGAANAERDAKVVAVARDLELDALLDRHPRELSGGQRQRVAIGRAMLRDPQVFLFDEPLSNLDAALRVHTRLQIARLHQETGRSMIYVTHDQVEAMTLADKIVLLNAGERIAREGSLAQVGTPMQLYHHPKTLFVAGFVGAPRMNFIPARVVEVFFDRLVAATGSGLRVAASVCADGIKAGDAVTLGIRPEHVGFGDMLSAHVLNVERFGDSALLYLESAETKEPIVMRTDGATRLRRGGTVSLAWPEQHVHVFDSVERALTRSVDPLAE